MDQRYFYPQSQYNSSVFQTEPAYGLQNYRQIEQKSLINQQQNRILDQQQQQQQQQQPQVFQSNNYYSSDDSKELQNLNIGQQNNQKQQIQQPIQKTDPIFIQDQEQSSQLGKSKIQQDQKSLNPKIIINKPQINAKLDNTTDQIINNNVSLIQDQQQQQLTNNNQINYQIEDPTIKQASNNNNIISDQISNKQIPYQNYNQTYLQNEDTAITRLVVQYPVNLELKKFPPTRDQVPVRIVVSSEKYVGFFYKVLPTTYVSKLIPVWMTNARNLFFMQFLLPMIIVLALHFIIWKIQYEFNDFCFLGKICNCQNNYFESANKNNNEVSVLVWSFIKQLVVYKLGHLSYKKIIINNAQKNKDMFVENFMLYFFTIGIDFIYIFFIKDNSDIRFLVYSYLLGIFVPLQVFHRKHYKKSVINSRGLFIYDLNYLLIFAYIYFVIAPIYNSIIDTFNLIQGQTIFVYIFPFLEWILDIIFDICLSYANKGELFIYQSQLIIIGLRVGVLLQISTDSPLFWYLMFCFFVKRINNSSQILNISFKKILFDRVPYRFKHLFSMQELKENYKGKQGSYFEHCVWIAMFYWYWGMQHLMAPVTKNLRIIDDCKFSQISFFNTIEWYVPFIIWFIFTLTEIVAIFVNKQTRFDTVKWIGAKDVSLIDNILIRMTGWYLFQIALMTPVLLFPISL